MSLRYPLWLNFVWYQSLWFTAVLGGNDYIPLLAALLLLHLFMVAVGTEKGWQAELMIMVGCGSAGIVVDSIHYLWGMYRFTDYSNAVIPLWLMSIWFGFAGTLRHTLSFVVGRAWLAVPAGLFCAPLVYMMAQRLGAVSYPRGDLDTGVRVGLGWALLMALFIAWLTICQERRTAVVRRTISTAN